MKLKIITVLLILGLITGFLVLRKKTTTPVQTNDKSTSATSSDFITIRQFMDNPNLDLVLLGKDLPTSYFRVGKVTKVGDGENMDRVDGWTREIDIYVQKELINETCSVYEYNLDSRNHKLTAVVIRGLKPSEVEDYKNKGITCSPNENTNKKISKDEAQAIAMNYLKRNLSNFDQIKDQFSYSEQNSGQSHDWLWEDKTYQLSDGLSSRPYHYPMIRISVYGNGEIQFWNTIPLFEN